MRRPNESRVNPPPSRWGRSVAWVGAVGALVLIAVLFPRVLAFAELAARELRVFWWLILLLALGVWLAFFASKRRS
jgi:cobalamin synthase